MRNAAPLVAPAILIGLSRPLGLLWSHGKMYNTVFTTEVPLDVLLLSQVGPARGEL